MYKETSKESYIRLPLDMTNPPRTKTRSTENVPNVLAITIVLPVAAMKRNRARAT